MTYTIQQLKADLTRALHGTSLNQIQGINSLISQAARKVIRDVDPQETVVLSEFAAPIFSGVYDYALPADVKGNKIIDIRPQTLRTSRDVFLQKYNQPFDISKAFTLQDQFTINFNAANKTIRINATNLDAPVALNEAESITGNGTWAVGGGASNLTVDNSNYVSGAGSLQFDLAAGQASGYLECTGMTDLDISGLVNQASLFLSTFWPAATGLTSVALRFGSSSANYYTVTATLNQQGLAWNLGWNMATGTWNSATVTGSPDSTDINYLRVTWNYDSLAHTAVRLDGIFVALGSIMEVEYYSKYLFRNSSGTFIETVSADSDLVNLDTESVDLLLYQVCILAAQAQQSQNALAFDATFYEGQYADALARYMAMYKAQNQKPQSTYYAQRRGGYSQYVNPRWR